MHQLAAEVKQPNELSNTTFVGETMILDKVTRDTAVSRVLTESFGVNDVRQGDPGAGVVDDEEDGSPEVHLRG